MKLLTEEQRTKLLANGTRRGADHKPVVKWFNPCGSGTWLVSELDPEYPDECAFGLADLGFGTPELGSIGLLELTQYRGPFGLGIERDIHFTAHYPLSIYAEAARAAGHIVESGPELEAAARILAGKPAVAAASAKPANRPRRTGAGLRDVRPHDLRHTYASIALMHGETVLTIGRLLGHDHPGTTLKYTNFADAAAREAVDTVSSVLRRA